MVDVLCVIQARSGSTRLPNKMLLTLQGQTLLERAIRQATRIFGANNVIVAMPANDDALAYVVADMGALSYRHVGDESDLVSRFWHAAKEWGASPSTLIVRWTPDDWRKDDALVRSVVYDQRIHEYSPSVEQSVEVFRMESLDQFYWSTPPTDREHIGHLLPPRPLPPEDGLPWSVDTAADYEAVVARVGR